MKPKNFDAWMDVRFLLTLSDGRGRGFMEIAQKLRVPISPTTQMFVDKLAGPLCKRGLVKSTFSGYKITDAGLAWLEQEGPEIFQQTFNPPPGFIESQGPDKLAALRKLAEM